jgi:hypothetical protein
MTDIKLNIKNLEIDFTITDKLLSRWVEMTKTSQPTMKKEKGKLDSSEVQQEVNRPTKDELRSVLGKIMKNLGRKAVIDLMSSFGGKLDLVDEDQYDELMTSAKEVLGD